MSEIAQTADHALRILEELGKGQPLSPGDLCERLELNRTVVHRLLKTLAARGFVLRHEGFYKPGIALVRLAQVIEPHLRTTAVPVMTSLAERVNETVVLHIVDGHQAVVLEQAVAAHHVVQVSHRIGSRHGLELGASGRAILAFLPEPVTAKVLAGAHEPTAVGRRLATIRTLGYALSHDELQLGVHGLAVPLLDDSGTAIGSLAILVPALRANQLEPHVDELLAAAAEIRAAHSSSTG